VEYLQSDCAIKDNKMEVLLRNKHINHGIVNFWLKRRKSN